MAAIKELPLLCKDNKEYVSKIADILVQLLQLNDPLEYNVACNSLLEVVKIDPIRVIKCIFNKIYVMDNEGREKALKFIITKLKSLDKSIVSTEVEDLIIGECKKVLQVNKFQFLLRYTFSKIFNPVNNYNFRIPQVKNTQIWWRTSCRQRCLTH